MRGAALLLAATLLAAACGEKQVEKKSAPPTLITTTQATVVALEVSERTLGSLEAVDDPKIGAEIAGKIVTVAVRAGEAVSKGRRSTRPTPVIRPRWTAAKSPVSKPCSASRNGCSPARPS